MRNKALLAMVALATVPILIGLTGQRTREYGPFSNGSPDSGTCGNSWADDTFDRFYKVNTRRNLDGSYDVVEQFKQGTFVTRAGASPGGCEISNPNPPQIPAGIRGEMQGQFWMKIQNGVYNPNANPGNVNDPQFVAAVFGPNATYTVYSFSLNYNARNRGDWKNASRDKGGNRGDIR